MYIGIVNRKTKTWYYDNCFMVKINSCAQLTYSVFHGALAVSTTSLLLSFCSLIYLLLQYWEMNPSIQPCMLGHPSQTLNCRGLSYILSPAPHTHTLLSILRQGHTKFPKLVLNSVCYPVWPWHCNPSASAAWVSGIYSYTTRESK